jgi:hypothetical protein
MQKYIELFENFKENQLKFMKTNTGGNWNNIRDAVQSLQPFIIINFKNMDGYTKYIENHNNDFIKQTYFYNTLDLDMSCPSIFVHKRVHVSKDDFEKYKLLNCIIGKANDPNIIIKSGDTSEIIGNEIVSTLSQNEVYPDSHYKIGSVFYKFINFFS